MIPAAFDYLRPATLEEAVALLELHGADAKVLAGGHSLVPAMKLRLAQPKAVIDIGRVTLGEGRIAGIGKIARDELVRIIRRVTRPQRIREVDGRNKIRAAKQHDIRGLPDHADQQRRRHERGRRRDRQTPPAGQCPGRWPSVGRTLGASDWSVLLVPLPL